MKPLKNKKSELHFLFQKLTKRPNLPFFLDPDDKSSSKTYKETYKRVCLLNSIIQSHSQTIPEDFIVVESNNPFDFFCLCLALWNQDKCVIPNKSDHYFQKNLTKNIPSHSKISITPNDLSFGQKKIKLTHFNPPSAIKTFDINKRYNPHALIIMTSGSSGAPKGVSLSLQNILDSAKGTNDFYEIDHKDSWALTLPLYHIGGFMIPMRCLLAGACVHDKSGQNWRDLIHSQTSLYSLVPTQLHSILNEQTESLGLLKKIKRAKALIIGGAKTDKNLLEKAKQNKLPLSLTYGLTEMCAQVCATKAKDFQTIEAHNVGEVLKFRQMELNEDSQALLNGKTLFNGYFYNKEITFPFNEKGQFLSQDRFSKNDKGEYFIQAREDRVFISGGENVNPEEIEAHFYEKFKDHDTYKNCFFFATFIEDSKFGQVPALYYYFDQSHELTKRIEFEKKLKKAACSLPSHMSPKSINSLEGPPQDILKNKGQIKFSRSIISTQIQQDQGLMNSKLPLFIHDNQHKDRNDKEVIIFIHGFMGSREDFVELYQNLKKRNTVFVSIELPGHGEFKTSHFRFFKNLDEVTRELKNSIALISSTLKTKVSVFGYSLGGRVLLQTLIKNPSLHSCFSKIYIESANPGLTSNIEKKQRKQKDQNLFEKISTNNDWEDFFEKWYSMDLFGQSWSSPQIQKKLKSKLSKELKKWGTQQLKTRWQKALNLMSVSSQDNLWPNLHKLPPCPLYLIYGNQDLKYKQMTHKMRDVLEVSHSNLTLISLECSHHPHIELPKQLAKQIDSSP